MKHITLLAVVFTTILLVGCTKPGTQTSPTDTTNNTDETVIEDTTTQIQEPITYTGDNHPYIGLTVEEAQTYATQDNMPFRVIEIDGEAQAATMDYRPGRINASVNSGVITSVTIE